MLFLVFHLAVITDICYYTRERGVIIMISYARLWNTMKEKGITQYALIKQYHISPAQITRLKRNESVSTHTIEVFCEILDCRVEDIMEYIKEER